jgi:hypothetical protein
MATGRILLWGNELVVDLPVEVFENNPPATVMFDASHDADAKMILVEYSAHGARRSRSYEPGFQGGRFPVLVEQELEALGWDRGDTVTAVFKAPHTLEIFRSK